LKNFLHPQTLEFYLFSDLKQAFEMFDKNNDGKISSEELGCVLRALGHEHSHKEVEDMIKNADTNGELHIYDLAVNN
jgi:calmodulin